MPEGSQKVEELDFNQFAGRAITVDDLISGMNHMGFQASSVGEAVRIINEMVILLSCLSARPFFLFFMPAYFFLSTNLTPHSAPGGTLKPQTKPRSS
jgi:deoxyhypusine synthase